MNSINKDILDILQQPGFKEWVHSPSEESDLFWSKWIEKNPDKQQSVTKAREFILRLNLKEQELQSEEQLSESEIDEILNNVIGSSHRFQTSPPSRDRFLWIKVAAVLAIIVSISFVILKIQQDVETNDSITYLSKSNTSSKKSQFLLPDGTRVNLNADSEITFPEFFNDSLRIVHLSGEAYFDVIRDENKPFKVISEDIVTTVLGTSFNISAYPETGQVHIALVSGKVAVQKNNPGAQSYLIKPGEKILFDQNSKYEVISNFDLLTETGWKEGILVFENASFPEFLSRLERWYGVEFLVQGKPAETWQIEGRFDNESLEEILKGVRFTHNLTYEINEKQVTIKF